MAVPGGHYDHLYKSKIDVVVLVGDAGVGKTHIISRYIKGVLPKTHFPTIGVEFATRNVPLKNGGVVKAQIWDTGRFHFSWARKISSNYCRTLS